ncbi:Calcium-activated chloride channel N-terminal, partial [Trinorchestia longiramus]
FQDVISHGSSVLYAATQHRVFIRQVTVVVPKSWSGGPCPRPVMTAPHPPQEAAISVGTPHPVYGHAPWTLQVGGCKAPGKRIYFTPDFLDQRNHSAVFSGESYIQ